MGTKQADPWAVCEKGFEPYAGPRGTDDFEPLDTQASDLAEFLQSAMERIRPHRETTETVTLPNGQAAQLSERGDHWELMVHAGRDFYTIFSAPSRDEVLRMAAAQ